MAQGTIVVSVGKRPKSPLSKDFSSTVGDSDLFGVVCHASVLLLSRLIHPSVLPDEDRRDSRWTLAKRPPLVSESSVANDVWKH